MLSFAFPPVHISASCIHCIAAYLAWCRFYPFFWHADHEKSTFEQRFCFLPYFLPVRVQANHIRMKTANRFFTVSKLTNPLNFSKNGIKNGYFEWKMPEKCRYNFIIIKYSIMALICGLLHFRYKLFVDVAEDGKHRSITSFAAQLDWPGWSSKRVTLLDM